MSRDFFFYLDLRNRSDPDLRFFRLFRLPWFRCSFFRLRSLRFFLTRRRSGFDRLDRNALNWIFNWPRRLTDPIRSSLSIIRNVLGGILESLHRPTKDSIVATLSFDLFLLLLGFLFFFLFVLFDLSLELFLFFILLSLFIGRLFLFVLLFLSLFLSFPLVLLFFFRLIFFVFFFSLFLFFFFRGFRGLVGVRSSLSQT